jgi:hypothetical protein
MLENTEGTIKMENREKLAQYWVRWPIQLNNVDIQYTEDYLSAYILPSNKSIAD